MTPLTPIHLIAAGPVFWTLAVLWVVGGPWAVAAGVLTAELALRVVAMRIQMSEARARSERGP
ncbi:MAG: hypothetical protein AAFR35_11265 [Pseudomonadota bacterium]